MNIEKVKIEDLHVSEINVRRHPQTQLDELARSFKMFGQYRPLIVAYDGEILVGNGLYIALKNIGEKEIEVIRLQKNTDDVYKKKLMIADNKIYSLGFDYTVNIDLILEDIGDFDIPGFDSDILNEIYGEIEDISDISAMGVIDDEKIQEIKKVETERVENPPEHVVAKSSSAFEPIKKMVSDEDEKERPYVNCPHCGTKIYI